MFSNLSYLTILFLLFMQAFFNFNLFTFLFFEFILFFIQSVTHAFEFFSCLVGETFVISSSLLSAFRNLPLELFVLVLSIAIIFKDASHLLQILLFFLHFFQSSDQLCNVSFQLGILCPRELQLFHSLGKFCFIQDPLFVLFLHLFSHLQSSSFKGLELNIVLSFGFFELVLRVLQVEPLPLVFVFQSLNFFFVTLLLLFEFILQVFKF